MICMVAVEILCVKEFFNRHWSSFSYFKLSITSQSQIVTGLAANFVCLEYRVTVIFISSHDADMILRLPSSSSLLAWIRSALLLVVVRLFIINN